MKKKLLVIGTGGTIASIPGDAGLTPGTDVSGLLSCVPQAAELCDWEQIQLFSLDSTNVGPAQWVSLAKCIRRSYEAYDGFLILHGTDTMAYTAAALSYLIQNSGKPIVLTGSQKPMEDTDTDAKRAGKIVQTIADIVPDVLVEKVEAGSCKTVSDVAINPNKVFPQTKKYVVMAGLLGAVLVCGVLVLAHLLHDTIVDDEDVQKKLGLPVLGLIPEV